MDAEDLKQKTRSYESEVIKFDLTKTETEKRFQGAS